MTTTVVFDLDGVLVDSRAVFLACVDYAFDKLGIPRRPREELLPYIGPPFPLAFGELLGEPPESPLVAAVIEAYRERYKTASLTETTVEPGIPEALDALAHRRLAVATSKPLAFTEPLLRALDLRERFDVVAGPDLGNPFEPKTETLARALRALGPTRAVMVGDRTFDVVAAKAHGIPSIGVLWGLGTRDELADADRLVTAPDELPDAAADLLGG
jgi:phosphoglycolate phosphatase